FENATGVDADLAIDLRNTDTVAYQASARSEFAKLIHGRYRMSRSQGNQFSASRVEKRSCGHRKRWNVLFSDCLKCCLDLLISIGSQNINLETSGCRSVLHLGKLALICWKVWVQEDADRYRLRHQLAQ